MGSEKPLVAKCAVVPVMIFLPDAGATAVVPSPAAWQLVGLGWPCPERAIREAILAKPHRLIRPLR